MRYWAVMALADKSLGDIAAGYINNLGLALIPLRAHSKEPATAHGLNDWTDDPEYVRDAFDAHPKWNMAAVLGKPSGGVVAIDIDVDDDLGYDGYEYLNKWEREHGELPETASVITGRGGAHLYYRVDREIKPSVNEEVHIDIRGDGSYAMLPPSVHPNGNVTQWENHPDNYPIADADDNVYAFIESVTAAPATRKRFKLPKEIKAGKRNDTLYRYGCSLRALEQDDDLIAAAIEAANTTRCKPPLPDDEVDKIIESVLTYQSGLSAEAEETKRKSAMGSPFRKQGRDGSGSGAVKHNVVARELIKKYRVCRIDGAPAIYKGDHYESGWDAINSAIVDMIDDCKMADQREIRNYLHLKAPRKKASSPCLIAFSNGVLDIDYGMQEPSDEHVITNIIPHAYNADAYSEVVDNTLDRISCGDFGIRRNLEEVIGMCMYRSNEFGQCPVLIGSGSNGKSTFILALRNVLGDDNVSSLDVNILGKNFQAGRLLGKLANLGDDISNERLNGDVLAIFKKIVTGEWIYTDVKNSSGFEFKPYCTLVISCNEFPRLGDSSEGMMRRLFPIPFDATFSKKDPGYDPRLWEKLSTEESAEYLIKLGLQGLQRVRYNRGLTPSKRSEAIVNEISRDNDSVLQWTEDQALAAPDFVDEVIQECYERYSDWCHESGQQPYSKTRFTRHMNVTFGLKTASTKRRFSTGLKDVRVFREGGR